MQQMHRACLAMFQAVCALRWHHRPLLSQVKRVSGAKGTRTPDPLLAKQVLYQLSYGPRMQASDLRFLALLRGRRHAASVKGRLLSGVLLSDEMTARRMRKTNPGKAHASMI
jgi:hypothetical protein